MDSQVYPSSKAFTYNVPSTSASDGSYAGVAQLDKYPKRDQGLVIDCLGSLNLTDYTYAVGDIVEPENILYSTRISNNRVCLYLKSSKLVDELTDKFEYLQIGEFKVTIRPLVLKQKRIIFSNVAPTIPDFVIENIMDELKIKRLSPVITLKASLAKDREKERYNHILSSRTIGKKITKKKENE